MVNQHTEDGTNTIPPISPPYITLHYNKIYYIILYAFASRILDFWDIVYNYGGVREPPLICGRLPDLPGEVGCL